MNISKKTFIFAASLMLSGCSSLLYQPTFDMYYPPEKLGLVPQELNIEVDKDIAINGWYFSSQKKPKALIIFFHGNAQNMTSHYTNLVWMLKKGYDFFIWDYRGFGKSPGNSDPENTVKDGVKVIQAIAKDHPHVPLIIFGESLGGAVAMRSVIELKHQIPIKAVVIDASFASYKQEARYVLSQHWISWPIQPLTYILLSDTYAPSGRIHEIAPTPMLIMHGDKDKTVGYQFGQDIFKEANEPKEFWTVADGQHIDVFWEHNFLYREKFLDYLNKLLATKSANIRPYVR
jgi:fermentation-respiration switch protein FrsA (DUF1100 family)